MDPGSRSAVGTECTELRAGSLEGWPTQPLGTPGPGEPRLPEAPLGSAPTAPAAPPPLRPQPAPPGTADGARRRRERSRGGWLCAPSFPRLLAQGLPGQGPEASAALEDAAAALGGGSGQPGALQVGARPLGRAETWAEFAGGAWGRGRRRCPRAPLPAGPRPRWCGSWLPPVPDK